MRPRRTPTDRAPRAFTLIELLVVIAIIALLIGILLPSLAGARRQAGLVQEMAAVRQLTQGYLAYAMNHDDALLPGVAPSAAGVTDDEGRPLSPPEAGRRWPWRLAGSMDAGLHGTLLVNERSRALADRGVPMWSYMVSLTPSFGLNLYNLGGDSTGGGVANAPGCLTRLDEAIAPTRMIVFASARSPGEAGPVHGYFKIVPPTKAFEYSAQGWSADPFAEEGEPAAWGYVHPRWNGRAATAHLDGHVAALGMDELRDMTRWSNPAQELSDPNWRAP